MLKKVVFLVTALLVTAPLSAQTLVNGSYQGKMSLEYNTCGSALALSNQQNSFFSFKNRRRSVLAYVDGVKVIARKKSSSFNGSGTIFKNRKSALNVYATFRPVSGGTLNTITPTVQSTLIYVLKRGGSYCSARVRGFARKR